MKSTYYSNNCESLIVNYIAKYSSINFYVRKQS